MFGHRISRASFLGAGLALLLAAASAAQDCPAPPDPDPVSFGAPMIVTLETADGTHAFNAEIARTPAQRSRGLMFRPEIAPDAGMLFIFDEEAPRSFFMRNTCASLDIIWIAADMTVVGVAKDTTPFSEDNIPSDAPAQFVLELAAGRADEIGLAAGDAFWFGPR